MAFSYACLVLQRVVLPAVLVLASLMRPVGISFVYMLMFFMSPFVPLATRRNFKGSVTAFFIILLALSTLVLLGHIALQVLALSTALPIYNCSFSERLLRHIGFVSFVDLRPLAIIEWLAPEVLVLATSLGAFLSVKRLALQNINAEQLENGELPDSQSEQQVSSQQDANGSDVQQATATTPLQHQQQQLRKRVSMISQHIHFEGLIKISPLFCLATLFFAAVLRPSVPGGFYFLIFLLAGTYWATCQTLQRGFALLLRCVMFVLVLHSLCIVSYQTPWMQSHLNHTSLAARLIGLEPLIESDCVPDIRILLYNNRLSLDSYLNPFALFFAYFALALTTKHLIKPRLVRQSTRKARTPQALESTTAAATTAPSGSRGNDIQLDTIERRSEQENNTTSILDQISYGFVSVGGFIYQNSYIFTNILMMAWSIVYHSWLTFVLLLWANVLWMIPNQRKAMMRSSPFIVLYAELLLVAQYIYGMDLNNNELPTRVSTAGINLQQIGFERPIENHMRPCVPLIVKTAFVLMFWVTSRQFFKEKRDRRRDSTLADIIAPLQITVGSAGSSYLINDGKKTSKFLKKAGDVIKNLLVRLWIWLLVLVIFLCAITGDDMTGFRICYMALFLFFLLVFQSSSKAWVKIMYGFWLFLIFYAMSILILIYTYQFDKFDMYWKDYLNVSQTLQADIGLKLYKTKDLFLHLVSPTIIVILTVIQVHYFHKRFIASLQQQPTTPGTRSQLTAANAQQKRTETAALEAAPSKRRGSASSIRQRSTEAAGTAAGATTTDFETSVRDLVRISFRKIKNKSEYIFKRFKTVFWRFLELHIMKAVYIAAFVCSVSEVCVLHIIFVGFCVLGATSRKAVQVVISRLISFIVTIIVLSKMIYQIEYLDHNQYSVTCSDNRTANNAEWIGLNKADKLEGGLMGLLRTYIIYMVIVTMHAVISLRQLQMRVKIGENAANQPKLLFQQITRADAEKDLVGLVKYLLNFGFYKFGIEISLIALVSTITYRQDIVAVVYAVWLVVLLLLKRSQCAKMWGVFQAFFAISILLQYIVLVGLPPSWCMSYPWDDGAFGESIQRWTMLPGQLHFNHVPKLIFDFIVLIILNRQKSIFCIEQRYATNDDYPGGSNRSVIADIAQLGRVPFDNPTHDFCSYIRNYSDILKNGILCGFYWFTLAVVFLAGTNIADLLALGYLIGAFVFLWQGSDFYLRPIATIISRWKWLLAFNVANILIKTSFQMAGCLFMTPLTTHCCWLVHMLGITCTSNVIKEQLHVADEAEVLTDSTGCPKMTHQVVLLWDAICFAFIIFQLRIFQSHYFCHIITDTKANNILASRGADIIESLRQKQIAHRHDHEKQVLHKIKRKMERIRATQQKMLRPLDKQTHFDGQPTPLEQSLSEAAPLAHQSSFVSCQGSGYQTPDGTSSKSNSSGSSSGTSSPARASMLSSSSSIVESVDSADAAVIIEPEINIMLCDDAMDYVDVQSASEEPEDTAPIKPKPKPDTLATTAECHFKLHTSKATTPSTDALSALLTEGFLEPKRISLGLAPSEQITTMQTLVPPLAAYATAMASSATSSVNLTPNLRRQHRRQSSTNAAVSWNETVSIKHSPLKQHASPEHEELVTLRQKSLHRRHLSMGNASYSLDEAQARMRRASNLSGARDEAAMRYAQRPHSWGPVGTAYYMESLMCAFYEPALLHGPSTRAGDYYMFEEMDDKFELDLIHDEIDFMEEENITESEMKMQRRKTLYDVWKDLNDAEYRRHLYMRERSYASEPGSRIQLKLDAEKEINELDELDQDRDDRDDDDDDTIECDIGIRTSTLSEPLDFGRRSQTLLEIKSKDAPTDFFPSTSKGVSKERDAAASSMSSPKPTKDLTDLPATSALTTAPREATSKETSDSKSKMELDSGDVTAKDSDEDFDTNPIIRLLEGFLVTLTIRLNRFSRNYRFVNRILAGEKKTLKESSSLNRLGLSSAAAMFHFLKSNLESDENGGQPVTSSTPRRTQVTATIPSATTSATTTSDNLTEHYSTPPNTNTNTNTTTTPLSPQEPLATPPQPPPATSTPHQSHHAGEDIIEIPVDTVDAAASRKQSISSLPPTKGRKSDCGLPEIRIKAPSMERSGQQQQQTPHHFTPHSYPQQHQQHSHHQQQASIGSGSLSKHWSYEHVDSAGEFNLEEENFAQRDHHIIVEVLISSWYALLANTDLICYIVVFINQVVNASLISLPLPIMVFLWGTLSLPRPTKTFWVTLIAYTQAIVLIKCIFQFKLIWSNYNNLPNQPLAPAKIFGVEMKTHYAVYDLILLLVLFLHRYLLKSQGLWKSGYKDVDQQFTKPTASIDEREDSDNLSQPDSRQLNDDAAQKMSLQVSQVSLPGSPEYSKSAINQLERTKYTSSLHKFFFSLVHKSRLATDVYALMFLCDFINFFVLLFGFTAFGTQQTESDGGVQTYLAENKVPIPFLIMLLVQFLLIVIDRALYLRKALVNKIIFHFFSVIGIHIWMFFVVPAVTERTFNSLAPPIIFYVIKCFYMLLSSYQIKSGYPKRILGNFFTKGFSMVNMIAFKVYMQIPFLYELRTILDWVCIDSTMTIFDWLKMEDIFSNIYLIRCTRQSETDFPAMRAQKKASLSKLIMGGTVVLLIVICIWGPLCLFALGNAVGSSNVPYQVSLSIRIGPYDPIYTTNNYDSIFEIDSKMYTQMTNAFFKNKQALTFIAGYDATDVAAVKLAGNSPSLWNIAPPDKQRLTNDLRNNHTLIARFSYSLTRKAPAKGLKENVGDEHVIKLDETFEGRAALINMLNETLDPIETNENGTTNGNNTTSANSSADDVVVVLPNMIPKFIKVLNSGDAFVATVMSGKEQEYRPLVIKLHRDKATKAMWWEIRDYCYDSLYNNTLKDLAYSDCKSGIVMYTFNDKKFPSTFSFLTAGGIIGLYTTFVLLASRFMKSFIGGQNRKIMFEDLPYVDRVLQLCLDIYLVREALEFALEEDLFAKLLFLYRSPETLIKWTRPKEEYLDDDGDTDSIPSRMSVRRPEQLQQHQYQQQQQQQQ
ncbi:piezo-type mechanosensitive ion channel component isoform X11 [Drosophila albomicans]|uniref:Piezo-type mechanosensitive ion channel component isoform X11 n=1 Tax=Drosophila albomicans TaxID=7291 RepID=A0A6P8WD63_DROAB|nr:piezo-type mechanosensitive ion channel component isoform X11 [Drosophila albomicans]